MQRIQDSYWFYLSISALLHLFVGIAFLGNPSGNSVTESLVQSNRGFSMAFQGTSETKGPEQNTDGSGPSSDLARAGSNNQGMLAKSIGQLQQSIPYPQLAYSQEIQGTVLAHVSIKEGKLVELSLQRSSGYDILDQQVIQSIRNWQWPPVTASRSFSVNFRIGPPAN